MAEMTISTPPTTAAPPGETPGKAPRGGRRKAAVRRVRRRLVHLLIVLIAVTFLSFVVIDLLPGDAAVVVAGDNATPAQVAQVRTDLGLDRPMLVRYVDWLGGVVTGDLGAMKAISAQFTVPQATVRALAAGADMALSSDITSPGPVLDALEKALADGTISAADNDAAVARILTNKGLCG